MLTDKQAISLMVGEIIGSRFTTILKGEKVITGVKSKPKRIQTKIGAKEAVTITYGSKESERGSFVDIPVYLSNNDPSRVGNAIGVAGFQLDMRFDPELLEYISISPVSWLGGLEVDTSAIGSGLLKVLSLRTVNIFEDMILVSVRFKVKETVPPEVTRIPLVNWGRYGSGAGSELFKIVDGDYFFITPIGMENGAVFLEKITVPKVEQPVSEPSRGYFPEGESIVDFYIGEFRIVGPPTGEGWSGSVNATIIAYVDGVAVGSYTFKATQGQTSYSGKFPIYIPAEKYGEIVYVIEIEPEEGEEDVPFYVLIPAFGFSATVTSEQEMGSELEPDPQAAKVREIVRLLDGYKVRITKPIDKKYSSGVFVGDGYRVKLVGPVKVIVSDGVTVRDNYKVIKPEPINVSEDDGLSFGDGYKIRYLE